MLGLLSVEDRAMLSAPVLKNRSDAARTRHIHARVHAHTHSHTHAHTDANTSIQQTLTCSPVLLFRFPAETIWIRPCVPLRRVKTSGVLSILQYTIETNAPPFLQSAGLYHFSPTLQRTWIDHCNALERRFFLWAVSQHKRTLPSLKVGHGRCSVPNCLLNC